MPSIHAQEGMVEYHRGRKILHPIHRADPTDTTFPKVMSVFKNWEALPVLDLGSRNGHTGYIDFIQPEEMSSPIMRGEDDNGRPFVAIRYMYQEQLCVETLFRRYTTGSTWTSGGGSVIGAGALTEEDLEFLARLVGGEEVLERFWKDSTVRIA